MQVSNVKRCDQCRYTSHRVFYRMPASERTFHRFSRLPVELQLAVWRKCLPCRVYELDTPLDLVVFSLESEALSPCSLWQTTFVNGRPPVISRVCRASRAIALEAGRFPVFTESIPTEARWASDNSASSWRDALRDSVHLNWTPAYQAHFNAAGSPLYCLAWNTTSVSRGGSLMIDYLYNDNRASIPERLSILKRLPNWKIVTRVVVVHADPRSGAATGVFGLLGDARIQLVEVSDEARIDAFFELAETCERKGHVTVRQELHRDSAESIKQKLRDVIVETFGSEKLLPPMHPVIMFRLCTEMCNRSGGSQRSVPGTAAQNLRGRGRGRGRSTISGQGQYRW